MKLFIVGHTHWRTYRAQTIWGHMLCLLVAMGFMNEPTSRPPQGFEFKTLILKNKEEKNSNVSPKLTESAYNFFFLIINSWGGKIWILNVLIGNTRLCQPLTLNLLLLKIIVTKITEFWIGKHGYSKGATPASDL